MKIDFRESDDYTHEQAKRWALKITCDLLTAVEQAVARNKELPIVMIKGRASYMDLQQVQDSVYNYAKDLRGFKGAELIRFAVVDYPS